MLARAAALLTVAMVATSALAQTTLPLEQTEKSLVAKYGEAQRQRANRGLKQAASFWRKEDGDEKDFQQFAEDNFAGDQTTLDQLFERLQFTFESLDGHLHEIQRDWSRQSDLDLGEIYGFDQIMAGFDPTAHIADDLFANKLAFVVLLNFPLTTLQERLDNGKKWSRREWAEVRLAQRFDTRIPADASQAESQASAQCGQFVATYNIWMHHLLTDDGKRLFPAEMRLLEHWNLRDEIKADYSDKENGLAKQHMILQVMERIVDQSIPTSVVDNPQLDWNPTNNKVSPAEVKDSDHVTVAASGPAPRYAAILKFFQAEKEIDKYSPAAPTFIDRVFGERREMSEKDVRAMLEQVLTSPLVPKVAQVIQKRLGRPLEPFDIWYSGFQPRAEHDESQLDEMTRKKYPNPAAYHADMPRMFEHFGFSKEKAKFLADNIIVDPARGSGHAMPASRRGDYPHLRTRIAKEGMDYKGYNIAVHEMGHNVEQVFSLNNMDYHTLTGVPNNAITEALAFVFQHRDMELLNEVGANATAAANKAVGAQARADANATLSEFWNTFEIAGVALVEIDMWHWMYDHPDASPEQLRDAVVKISKETWNRYYAPALGHKDSLLLGIYAHMVNNPLYLADYPIGHIVAFQIEGQMQKAGKIGPEFERMTSYGNVTPNLWMENATGAPISPDALLKATELALHAID